MDIIQSVVLGVVEGATEFLPISSTFHLIFVSKFLGISQTDFTKLFEVFVQSGAIFAVFLIYSGELLKDRELLKKTLASFVPTAVVGLLLYKVIKNVFFNADYLMLSMFVFVGLLFIAFEYLIKKDKIQLSKKVSALTYKQALIIGLIQAVAVIPGVSRAGSVLLGMMFFKFRRDEAVRYSFVLSIPTILAASAYDLFKMRHVISGSGNNLMLLVVGFITALISAYFVSKWLIRYLQSHTLIGFGIYRIVLAIIVLLSVMR